MNEQQTKIKYKFFVKGDVKGKARPRLGRAGVYTPSSTKNYECNVKKSFLETYKEIRTTDKPIKLFITCYYKQLKSMTKKEKMLIENDSLLPTKKPDIDNIAKIILDALNKLAYNDDKQIIDLHIKKLFAKKNEEAGVLVEIEEIDVLNELDEKGKNKCKIN